MGLPCYVVEECQAQHIPPFIHTMPGHSAGVLESGDFTPHYGICYLLEFLSRAVGLQTRCTAQQAAPCVPYGAPTNTTAGCGQHACVSLCVTEVTETRYKEHCAARSWRSRSSTVHLAGQRHWTQLDPLGQHPSRPVVRLDTVQLSLIKNA